MSILKLTGENKQPVYVMREAVAYFKPVTVMAIGQPIANMTAIHLVGGGDVNVHETPDAVQELLK